MVHRCRLGNTLVDQTLESSYQLLLWTGYHNALLPAQLAISQYIYGFHLAHSGSALTLPLPFWTPQQASADLQSHDAQLWYCQGTPGNFHLPDHIQ